MKKMDREQRNCDQLALLKEKIEATTKDNIPSFMWYKVGYEEPYLQPDGFTVLLHFSSYRARIYTNEEFSRFLAMQLKESIHKLKKVLTPEETIIWNWLETGETKAEVWAVDAIRVEYDKLEWEYLDTVSTKETLNLSHFRLRDKTIWAAYSEDRNTLAYMEETNEPRRIS